METLALLASLVGIILLASYIWLAVVAFHRGVLWGVLILLLSPITAVIFAVKYWVEAKKPFLLYMVCFTLYFSYTGYIFVHMGGPEIFNTADRIERGEFSEEDAFNFMEDTMNRMDSSGLLDEQEKQDLAEVQTMLNALKEDYQHPQADLNDPSTADPAPESSRPTPQRHPYGRPRLTYQDVPLPGLTALINMPIRVFDQQGREHNVTLLGVGDGNLKLRKNIGSGTFDFELPTAKIERIQALAPAST